MRLLTSDGQLFRITAKGKNLDLTGADQELSSMDISVGDDTLPAKNVPCTDKGNTKMRRETPL